MKRWIVIVPSLVVLALIVMLGYGLTRNPRILPSAFINKPAPALHLTALSNADEHVSLRQFRGHVALVNVWASWCVACRSEVVLLQQITQRTGVPIIGLDYKDQRPAAQRWLKHFGDPFAAVAFDSSGDTGINWGVTGVPETFVIDADGMIRDKVVGPVTEQTMRNKLIPELNKLKESS